MMKIFKPDTSSAQKRNFIYSGRGFFILILGFLALSFTTKGQNPIVSHIFTADPAAIVHNDTVYIYTGHDEAGIHDNNYLMKDWHVFSSTDLVSWTDHGAVLNVTQFSWAKGDAWAGEVEERNGKFYFYMCAEHKTIPGKAIGVAVGDSPTGPFTDVGYPLITNNMTTDINISWDDIDPSVFVDDDGQAYLYWGNSVCHYVKLKPNMIETDGPIYTVSLPSFTEAPYIHKFNNMYYLSFAHQWPEKIAYATSSSITGPWTFRGAINDYVNNCGTNHHSIIEYKNQWYFIYHTGDIGGDYRRSVAVDYLFYNSDGTIKPIVQTIEGVSPADSACLPINLDGNMKINSGSWSNVQEATLTEGNTISLEAITDSIGTWSWRGPGEYTAGDTSSVELKNVTWLQSGTYTAIFTKSCGTKSYISFNITVTQNLPSNIISGKTYILYPRNSNLALTVQNGSIVNGANIIQDEYLNQAGQRWVLTNVDGVYWRISPENSSSKGLDVNNFSKVDGATIQTWDYWGGTTQQWQIMQVADSIYQFKARHSEKCLELENTISTTGALAKQWTCRDTIRQQFTLIEAVTTASINAKDKKKEVWVSPNPSDGNISIHWSEEIHPVELVIVDLSGKEIYRNTKIDSTLTRTKLTAEKGIYFIKLSDGKTIYVDKLVIQ